MNEYSENNTALLLSVCYGFIPDTAIKLTACAGDTKKRNRVINNELESFFNKHYDLSMQIFNDYKDGSAISFLVQKYHIADLTVRRYLDSLESHYMEFKGMIETKMITETAHPKLSEFLKIYGEYYDNKQAEDMEFYNLYQAYLNGDLSRNKLVKITHMTPKRLCAI